MTRIAQVNLNYNPKTLWFDAGELDVHTGDALLVTTARGTEFGHAAADVFEASDEEIACLKSPLKPVLRIATQEDEAQAAKLDDLSAEALPIFKEMAAESNEDMQPVSVEYLFDGDKAVFYFESEDRVDFRDLVRKLASRLHVRVDMRQIGVRDEARMVGGLGHCGQELCCKRLGGEFNPVSIRMAKEQDLSLNPQKISGVCGRLMCCLRYEYDAYKDFKSRAPKQNAQIDTPDGPAKVIALDVPREEIHVKIEDEKTVKIPLSDFEPPDEGQRPHVVGKDAWEEANARASFDISSNTTTLLTSQLSGHDKLAEPAAVGNKDAKKSSRGDASDKTSDKTAAAKNSSRASGKDTARKGETSSASGRKPRRRRSTKLSASSEVIETHKVAPKQQKPSSKNQQASGKSKDASKKPGQKSSQKSAHGNKTQTVQSRHGGKPSDDRAKQGGKQTSSVSYTQRPGQKSSALRQKPQSSSHVDTSGTSHRRTRRRSHKAGNTDESKSEQ